MKNLLFILILGMISPQGKSQKIKKCSTYIVLPCKESTKDSVSELTSVDYYDNKGNNVRSVKYEKGKELSFTINKYNIHGDLISKVSTNYSPRKVYYNETNKYVYDKNNKMVKVVSLSYVHGKFYEAEITTNTKYSSTTIRYQTFSDFNREIYDRKAVDIYDEYGKTIASYSIDKNGDTLSGLRYAYFPIQDITKIRTDTAMLKNMYTVSYLNKFGKEELLEYYHDGKPGGTERKIYDAKGNLVNDSKYSETIWKTDETIYTYDKKEELMEKKVDNIDEGSSAVYSYQSGKIIRENHFYGGVLIYSIAYKYEPELK